MAARSLSLPTSRLWRKYNVSLRTSPVATKSITCMAAYIVGDLSAQISSSPARRVEDKLAALDVARTARMALYGLMWCGPAGHKFYRWLDKTWMPGNPTAVAAVAGKVGIDQLLFSPLSTAVFFTWANLAAATPGRIAGDLSEKFAPSVRAAWALWVPAMTVNMALVPPPMRILFINAMAIVWTNILSSMASSAPEATPEPAEMPLDLAQLAEALLAAEPTIDRQYGRTPRDRLPASAKGKSGGKEPHASRKPRGTREQQEAAGARSPRASKESHGAGGRRAHDGGRVSSPQGSVQEPAEDLSFAWLFGLLRAPEDDEAERRTSFAEADRRSSFAEAERRNSFAESAYAAGCDDDVKESTMHRVDTQALMDDAGDTSAFADLAVASDAQEIEPDNSVLVNELAPAL